MMNVFTLMMYVVPMVGCLLYVKLNKKETTKWNFFLVTYAFAPVINVVLTAVACVLLARKVKQEGDMLNKVYECPDCGHLARKHQLNENGRSHCCSGQGRFYRSNAPINQPKITDKDIFKTLF